MKSILLVDDEAAICVELQRTLQAIGYHVEIAHTVESTLGSVREARFDAILVEFDLKSECGARPRTGGGIRLIRDLRKSGITIPILAYTVMEGEMYERIALRAGADKVVLKAAEISGLFSGLLTHVEQNQDEPGVSSSSR